MVAEKKYLYDLSIPEKKVTKKEDKFKLIKNTNKNKVSKKNKASLVFTTLMVFAMFMVITYRYNVISEKNLQVQKLKDNLEIAKANLATTQIALEEVMDVNYIESYAKQQLGMQKPEKNQLIYVSMENQEGIEKTSAKNMITSLLEKVKGVFNSVI